MLIEINCVVVLMYSMTPAQMPTSRSDLKLAAPLACIVALIAIHGCQAARQQPPEQQEPQPETAGPTTPKTKPTPYAPTPIAISGAGRVDFDINWPPRPLTPHKPSRRSLLTGQLFVQGENSKPNSPEISITLTLTRPHATNADRKFWNTMTEFKQYKHWMPYVQGRTADGHQWLWPNLAYLFKARGADRIERYGGWDRKHKNDNDFGGILIRKLTTVDSPPLVSADWHAPDAPHTSRFDIVHTAQSDTFTLHPENPSGSARLWFIYGDFMTWRPPWKYAAGPMKNRPLKKEYSGGIIAQFRIDWRYTPSSPFEFKVTQETPSDDTHFPWRKWISRKASWDTPKAHPNLTDKPK